jgi:hypothetical protein
VKAEVGRRRNEAALAATLAYWTPERRAQQWAHTVATGAAVDVGNAIRRLGCGACRGVVQAEQAVYEAAFAALISSPAFEAKIAEKRAMLNERASARPGMLAEAAPQGSA